MCGGREIRTRETFLPTSFQDWLHRPLGQPSWLQHPSLADAGRGAANDASECLEEHRDAVVGIARGALIGGGDDLIRSLAH
jgi:hypothetical protein